MEYKQIDMARFIAKEAFKDKKDLAGQPYYNHLDRVAKNFKEDTYMFPIAYLHDILEDCPEWKAETLAVFFDQRIVEAVIALTKLPDEDYFDYIKRVSECFLAKDVKIADLKDNMNVSRLKNLDDKAVERLRKYHKAYNMLIK